MAYWDVAPPELVVSAWIALDDAPLESGCLRVLAGSHGALVEHGLAVGRLRVPKAVS
ncbi:MAG: phytanoyl-CoA dioxygenase family protein, partial [Candidatus Methylomirabilales bacterium]